MNGLGFLIWQLARMPEPQELANLLKAGRVKWVSIKTLNGTEPYNSKGGNQKLLKSYWQAIQTAGVKVGFWHYVYGDQSGLEGDRAAGFIEEFSNDGLEVDHLLINAEGPYKRTGANKAAKAYCDKLPKKTPAYLCSYKFPSKHRPFLTTPGFPFEAFMRHERITGTAPQVYWIGANNPIQQTQQSFTEYRAIAEKPFIPIGSSFGDWADRNKTIWWEPTLHDLDAFIAGAGPTYGFYSLDWILQKNKMDWFQVITKTTPAPPQPPEISDHEKISRLWAYAQEQEWDV